MSSSSLTTVEVPSDLERQISDREKIVAVEGAKFEKVIAPVDEGYSWVICACCFVFNFCTWGMNSGYAIYLAHYLQYQTFPNTTKMDYGYIGGLAFGLGLCFSPLLNSLYNTIGLKPMVFLGNCIQFAALMLASFATNRWQIFCTQGALLSFGLAVMSIPMMTILPQYFDKYRVLAGGLATSGSGVGGLVFNLGMQKVTETRSVFWALRAQAIISFGMILIATIFLRSKVKRGSSTVKLWDDLNVYLRLDFWIFSLFLITCILGYVILLYTLSAFTVSLGYTPYQGSIVSASVQVGLFFGRPLVGLLSDKIGPITMACICYTLCGILCFAMWIPARNYATVVVFALWQGGMMGCLYGMLSATVQRIYGASRMTSVFSKIWVFVGISGIFSPVIGIKLTKGNGIQVDPTLYLNCAIFTGSTFLGAALFLLLLRGHINAREHAIMNMNQEKEASDVISIHSHISVPILLILTNCFGPPIKREFEKTAAILHNEEGEEIAEKIIEYKLAVI